MRRSNLAEKKIARQKAVPLANRAFIRTERDNAV
jgi:hypothetical protein